MDGAMPALPVSDLRNRAAERRPLAGRLTRVPSLPLWLPWVITGVLLLRQSAFPPSVDTAWLIAVGRRLLEGDVLHSQDLVEINLPLIMEFKACTVWVADLVKLDPFDVWLLFVGTQIVSALWLLWRMLGVTGLRHHRSSVLSVAALVLAAVPGVDFGQREHLVALWLVPYVASAACRASGAPSAATLRMVAGALAGLALCIKPHYAIVVAVVEAIVWRCQAPPRRWASFLDPVAVVAVAATYLGYMWLSYPGFFQLGLPLASQYYGAYRYVGSAVRPVHLFYPVLAMALAWVTRRLPAIGTVTRVYVIGGMGGLIVFAIQDKGFAYHYLPAKIMFLIAAGTAAVEVVRVGLAHAGLSRPAWRSTARLAMIFGLVGTAVALQQRALARVLGEESWRRTQRMESVLERL